MSPDAISTCRTCGYTLDHRVIEEEWQDLERCPRCDAYYWTPEPIKIPARAESSSVGP